MASTQPLFFRLLETATRPLDEAEQVVAQEKLAGAESSKRILLGERAEADELGRHVFPSFGALIHEALS